MGGFGIIGEAAEDFAAKEGKAALSDMVSKIYRGGKGYLISPKDLLMQSETGKILNDYIENTIIPQTDKTSQTYFDAAVQTIKAKKLAPALHKQAMKDAAVRAAKDAVGDVRKTYFGKYDEVLIKSIYDASKEKGYTYGNQVADAITSTLHDTGEAYKLSDKNVTVPSWRTRRVKLTDEAGEKGISLSDVGIREKALYRPPTDFESGLRSAMGWMYAPLVAIPHMAQTGGILLDSGFKATAKALSDYTKVIGGADDILAGVIRSGVLFNELKYEMIADASGRGLFEKLFHFPAFNWVRRQELTLAALAGKHAALDAADKLGKDSGDKWARYTLERLGIKFDDAVEKGFRLGQDDIEKAMYSEANQSIMIHKELYTPWKWGESEWARMGFQFKDFAYRYGRYLATTLKNSFTKGGIGQGLKTISIFATLFPAMGEVVHSLENLATARNPLARDKKGTDEYLDAIGHVGGLGILYSMWRAGMYNYGRGYLLGPVASTAEDVFIGIPTHLQKGFKYQSEGDQYRANKQYKAAARLGLSKIGVPGRIAAAQLKEEK